MKHCGIYCFTHIESGKKYVGSSVDIGRRRCSHIAAAKRGAGSSFHRKMMELGIENFIFEILELCDVAVISEREMYWIDFHDAVENGFNVRPNAWGDHHYGEAVRVKISASSRQEWRRKLVSEQSKAMHADPEFKKRWSQISKDRHQDPEYKAKFEATKREWLASEDGKKMMLERNKKTHENPEYTAANIKRFKSLKQDPEFEKKRAEALRLKQQDPEWKKNAAEMLRARNSDPEFQKKCKETQAKLRLDPSHRERRQERIKAGVRRRFAENPEIREAKVELMRKRNSDPVFKAKLAENRRLRKINKENAMNQKDSVDLFS